MKLDSLTSFLLKSLQNWSLGWKIFEIINFKANFFPGKRIVPIKKSNGFVGKIKVPVIKEKVYFIDPLGKKRMAKS